MGTINDTLGKVGGSGQSVLFLLILAIVIHIADIMYRLSGTKFPIITPILFAYIALAFFASLVLKKESESILEVFISSKNNFWRKFGRYFFLSAIAYSLPFINYLSLLDLPDFVGIPMKIIITGIIFWTPIWPMYLMFVETNKATALVGTFYGLVWITVLLISFYPAISTQVKNAELPGVMPGMSIGMMMSWMYERTTTGAEYITAEIKKQRESVVAEIAFAKTGIDPTQAKIDESKQQNVNVLMEKLKPTSQTFFSDSPVTVSTTLKVKTLEEPTQIDIDCIATSTPVTGKIFPQEQFNIESSDIQEIDCVLPPLDPGKHTVTLTADFNFETLANIETFFMPEETIRQLQSKQIDPMAGYPQPEAITSSGPINLNIHTPQSPIPSADDKKFTIGITILNTGGGTLKDITDLYIYLPKGIVLSEESRETGMYEPVTCAEIQEKEICDETKANIYRISHDQLRKPQYKDIKMGTEFRMYLVIQDYYTLIGDSPIKPGSITASIKYDYKLEQKVDIDVKNPPTEV